MISNNEKTFLLSFCSVHLLALYPLAYLTYGIEGIYNICLVVSIFGASVLGVSMLERLPKF